MTEQTKSPDGKYLGTIDVGPPPFVDFTSHAINGAVSLGDVTALHAIEKLFSLTSCQIKDPAVNA